MPARDDAANPVDQLVELLVYAPVGLLYEYREVVPRLVERGRSQVQLALLLGRMAARQARSTAGPDASTAGHGPSGSSAAGRTAAAAAGAVGAGVDARLEDAVGTVCTMLARAVTELGANIGLAPPRADRRSPEPAEPEPAAPDAGAPDGPAAPPIAGYDELTAREIIALLGDLTPEQRRQVRAHEQANRGRKTILAKLDQLDASG